MLQVLNYFVIAAVMTYIIVQIIAVITTTKLIQAKLISVGDMFALTKVKSIGLLKVRRTVGYLSFRPI